MVEGIAAARSFVGMSVIPSGSRRYSSIRGAAWVAVTIGCVVLPAPSAAAQSAAQSPSPSRAVSCLDTLSMAGAIPNVVYVHAMVADSTDARLAEMADVFAQSVAQRLRQMFSPHSDTLPSGAPIIGWRDVRPPAPQVRVRLVRNSPPRFDLAASSTNIVGGEMLLRAAHVAQDDGEGVFWPGDTPGDSLTFRVGFSESRSGTLEPARSLRTAFPVFYVMAPPETPVGRTSSSAPPYPANSRNIGATGVVIVQFEVDSTGHVMPATIREVWSSTQPRPKGQLLDAYNEFLHTVVAWLPTAEFTPARIGSCAVPQLVQQPFTFDIR